MKLGQKVLQTCSLNPLCLASLFIFFPVLSLAQGVNGSSPANLSEPLCFIQLENGQQVDLTSLCGTTVRRRVPRPLSSFYNSPLKIEEEASVSTPPVSNTPPSSPAPQF